MMMLLFCDQICLPGGLIIIIIIISSSSSSSSSVIIPLKQLTVHNEKK